MKLPTVFDVTSLPYTGTEPCIYWGKRGFGVRVYANSKKKYVLSYRALGRKRLLTLGDCDDVSFTRAEDLAGAYRLQVAGGADPILEKRLAVTAQKTAPAPEGIGRGNVNALCDAYLARHASKKRSGYSDKRLVERFVRPTWGKLKVKSICRAQVAMLHTQVSEKTPGQANRLLSIIKTMWKKAGIWGFIPESHPNPACGIPMNRETPRERFVRPSELAQLIAAVEQESDVRIRAALWLYLLTGARKSELLEATWANVDLDRRELRIPKPKQGKPHIYPLSSLAMVVLKQLPRFEGNPYLIPGDKMGNHLVNISKAWTRVRCRAGLNDVWLHDLRRSVGSWLAMSGHSLLAIGKVLGHSSPRTTQIYARLVDEVPRLALESHAQKLIEVLHLANK